MRAVLADTGLRPRRRGRPPGRSDRIGGTRRGGCTTHRGLTAEASLTSRCTARKGGASWGSSRWSANHPDVFGDHVGDRDDGFSQVPDGSGGMHWPS